MKSWLRSLQQIYGHSLPHAPQGKRLPAQHNEKPPVATADSWS